MSYDQNPPSDGILLYGGFSLAHASVSAPPNAVTVVDHRTDKKPVVVELTDHYGVTITPQSPSPKPVKAKPYVTVPNADGSSSPKFLMKAETLNQIKMCKGWFIGGWDHNPSPSVGDDEPNVEDWLARKVREKFDSQAAAMAVNRTVPPDLSKRAIRTAVHQAIGTGIMDRAMSAAMGASKTVPPTLPVTQRVLFDGYALPHVVGASEVQGWVDVLVFDDDERPMWDNAKGGWKTERLTGEVKWIKG